MKSNLYKIFMTIIIGSLSTGCSIFGVRSEEQPNYKVLVKQDNKEVRIYEPYIVAKTTIIGTYKEAQNKGFKALAGYIFGKNKSQSKIAMTAPVIQKSGPVNEKIAMTAPVIIAPSSSTADAQSWTMAFSMPSKYKLDTLPKPDDTRIVLEQVPQKYVAANTFTGFWGKIKNKKKSDELILWLKENNKYKVSSEPMFAGYNPPWTLPFLRRNEMLIEVQPSN